MPENKTEAVHISDDHHDVVGILNLRVVIVKDEAFWFAQGLEIDYTGQGESVDDVKAKFEGDAVVACLRQNRCIQEKRESTMLESEFQIGNSGLVVWVVFPVA